MRRRNLIFGLLAIATTRRARAEQSIKVHRIAIVHSSHPVAALSEESFSPGIKSIFTELRRLGYVEGKNLLIDRYSGEGRATSYPDLARDVVASNPDLIIAIGHSVVLDFKATETKIPIIGVSADPVGTGIGELISAGREHHRYNPQRFASAAVGQASSIIASSGAASD
jgi:putative ABC transport system substrate-binding protein